MAQRIIVTTDGFPASAPRGSILEISRVTSANTPPVNYTWVRGIDGLEIGLYDDEFRLMED